MITSYPERSLRLLVDFNSALLCDVLIFPLHFRSFCLISVYLRAVPKVLATFGIIIWYFSSAPRTPEDGTWPFFIAGTRRKTVTRQKCHEPRQHSLKKEQLRRKAINLAPVEKDRAWRNPPHPGSSNSAGFSVRDMNADFLESVSDGLDRLPHWSCNG